MEHHSVRSNFQQKCCYFRGIYGWYWICFASFAELIDRHKDMVIRGVCCRKITPLLPIFLGFGLPLLPSSQFTSAAANFYLGGAAFSGESTFPFLYIIIFQWWESSEPPSSTPVIDRHMCSGNFCTKFNAAQLLFLILFDVMRFLTASSPKLNQLSHFCILLYFKDGNLQISFK